MKKIETTKGNYQWKRIESEVKDYWKEKDIYKKCKEKVEKAEKFYFCDGPPYTSGHVHLGTCWNKVLKDCLIRYKRMRGYNVWDRPGYDMHGLPSEKATERYLKEQGITVTNREEIYEYGIEKYIEHCRQWCLNNMAEMNKVFVHLGVWMNWEDPYMSIQKQYMEGEWWLIKRAHERGRLYEGEKTVTWDAVNGTTLAKHELEYKTVKDTAIYVRMKAKNEKRFPNTYFVVWTTTPWTIPFNLAMMVHSKLKYVRVKVTVKDEEQYFIVCEDLVKDFLIDKLKIENPEIVERYTGKDLEGEEYDHCFNKITDKYKKLKELYPKVHSVLIADDVVSTKGGTGIVHCAPGCGPEDYRVGQRNGIKPFNKLDHLGVYRDFEPFNGMKARKEDYLFTKKIDENGGLVFKHKYEHEYPHGERSKEGVLFVTTKQWFFKTEDDDFKKKLIEQNDHTTWIPHAAHNAFASWLENLVDNSISRQRFWGTPLPIWRNVDLPDDYLVFGSAKELAEAAGLEKEPEDLHIPTVDKIVFERKSEKDGKVHQYKRVPDVLDVWIDAGTATWNCLKFPSEISEKEFKEWFPMPFILEGKDQIRGWFNLLHIASNLAWSERAFKNCYMHGFVLDSQGRKMSKSLGNYILPNEVYDNYGVDCLRLYFIGAANPGLDMQYNPNSLKIKQKNLGVIWNVFRYLLDMKDTSPKLQPVDVAVLMKENKLDFEEKYVLSKLSTTVTKITDAFDLYHLNETPAIVENFVIEVLSKTYLQMVWEKATGDSKEDKTVVLSVLVECLTKVVVLLAPLMPYFSERVYHNIRNTFGTDLDLLKPESVHLCDWIQTKGEFLDKELVTDMNVVKDVITTILACRDKSCVGAKWPLNEALIDCDESKQKSILRLKHMILNRTNVRNIKFGSKDTKVSVRHNKSIIDAVGKENMKNAISYLRNSKNTEEIVQFVKDRKKTSLTVKLGDKEFNLSKSNFDVTEKEIKPWFFSDGKHVRSFLDVTLTPELEIEGYSREIARRIQMARKNLSLKRRDAIDIVIGTKDNTLYQAVDVHKQYLLERGGVSELKLLDNIDGVPQSADDDGNSLTEKISIKKNKVLVLHVAKK